MQKTTRNCHWQLHIPVTMHYMHPLNGNGAIQVQVLKGTNVESGVHIWIFNDIKHWSQTDLQTRLPLANWYTPHPLGEGTLYLGHGREALQWWPPLLGFSIWLGPYFIHQHDLIDPLFLQKKSDYLYHI